MYSVWFFTFGSELTVYQKLSQHAVHAEGRKFNNGNMYILWFYSQVFFIVRLIWPCNDNAFIYVGQPMWLLSDFTFEVQNSFQENWLKAGGRTIQSETLKLINSIWNKEELLEQWKESIIVHIYKKGDKTDHSNYQGISLLSPTYKILSNILLSRLTLYAEEIRDHQLGFQCNRSTLVIILRSSNTLEKRE
jgi:hypothetical protein